MLIFGDLLVRTQCVLAQDDERSTEVVKNSIVNLMKKSYTQKVFIYCVMLCTNVIEIKIYLPQVSYTSNLLTFLLYCVLPTHKSCIK